MINAIKATKDRLVIVSPILSEGVLTFDRSGGVIEKAERNYEDKRNGLVFIIESRECFHISMRKDEQSLQYSSLWMNVTGISKQIIIVEKRGNHTKRKKVEASKEQLSELLIFMKPLSEELLKVQKQYIESL